MNNNAYKYQFMCSFLSPLNNIGRQINIGSFFLLILRYTVSSFKVKCLVMLLQGL